MTKDRPFEDDECLSSSDVETLADWLRNNCVDPSMIIGGKYTIASLIDDLDKIDDGMWNDGIDAMGEDA